MNETIVIYSTIMCCRFTFRWSVKRLPPHNWLSLPAGASSARLLLSVATRFVFLLKPIK